MSWKSELEYFVSSTADEQWRWLARLLFVLTMLARNTYTVGSDDLDKPREMRRFNELIHRTASQLKQIASASRGMPDDVFVKLLDAELTTLEISGDELAKLLH